MSEDEAIGRVVEAILGASACCEHDDADRSRLRTALKELLAAHDAERDARVVEDCYNPRCELARHAGACTDHDKT